MCSGWSCFNGMLPRYWISRDIFGDKTGDKHLTASLKHYEPKRKRLGPNYSWSSRPTSHPNDCKHHSTCCSNMDTPIRRVVHQRKVASSP